MTCLHSATAVAAVAATVSLAWALPAQTHPASQPSRLEALQAAGPRVGLVLCPVRVLGRADPNVANALGLVLERSGMTSLETLTGEFVPAPSGSWSEVPAT